MVKNKVLRLPPKLLLFIVYFIYTLDNIQVSESNLIDYLSGPRSKGDVRVLAPILELFLLREKLYLYS